MTPHSPERQLVAYLADAHSIERQALSQLRRAPDSAGDPTLSEAFVTHLLETERHCELTRGRLEAHGESPSKLKDAAMSAGGVGFLLFARSQPDTTGKLAAHAFSYEHLELAAYELLERVAQAAGDEQSAAMARTIRDEEAEMARRIERSFDGTVEASLRERGSDGPATPLTTYLADVHALETQAIGLLERGERIAGDAQLEGSYSEHLEQTRGHRRAIAALLDARDESPSRLKDAAMKAGALNWGMFFQAQRDTAGKLAAFAYAFEHLEIAAYEQLRRVAQRAGDERAAATAERILGEERAAAARIAGGFDAAARASLQAAGVA